MTERSEPAAIVERLNDEYQASVTALRSALQRFLDDGAAPDPKLRRTGAFAYPELRLVWPPGQEFPRLSRAYARLSAPGAYSVTVTRPDLFGPYLVEQLTLLMRDFDVQLSVGRSAQEIPFPYVLDGTIDLAKADVGAREIARHFPTTELAHIGDEIADGFWTPALEQDRPLALFDGLRTDFSLARLAHYTGTPAEHVQPYVLFTNYHRYVDEFVAWACAQLRSGGPYKALSAAGRVVVTAETPNPEMVVAEAPWRARRRCGGARQAEVSLWAHATFLGRR